MKQFEIWIANLEPAFGTEPGKLRPVVIVQCDVLNSLNPNSTIVCPITTKVVTTARYLRINIPANSNGLVESSDIMLDQIRAIDNKRFRKYIGILPGKISESVKANLKLVLDLED
jgi:mRNA interferase MazF